MGLGPTNLHDSAAGEEGHSIGDAEADRAVAKAPRAKAVKKQADS